MTKAEILTEHPELNENQIINIEEPLSDDIPENISSILCASLEWVRDDGKYSVYKATSYVVVRVVKIKNGKPNGTIDIALSPPNTISFIMNLDGLNYDSFSC